MRRVKNTCTYPFLRQLLFLYGLISAISLPAQVKPGAWNTADYFPLLKNKRIALVTNQTSTIGNVHLVDTLQSAGFNIKFIFAPEHGFRGNAANGEKVKDTKDSKTGLPVFSLYGKNIKPTPSQLSGIDYLVFDIQDVGVRFYTYLTTLHFVMEACAENNIPLILLDRPNPNGYFIDGPILDTSLRSMVGMHPIPIVHGMTLGELAQMMNGQKWLKNGVTCSITVIPCSNWNHNTAYSLPVPPSPNLPTNESIILYPTLGLFEGTPMSVGRGTNKPFECFGAPWLKSGRYVFVPKNIPGKAANPPFVNDTCHGYLVTDFAKNYLADFQSIYLEWFELLLNTCPDRNAFFNPFFDKLAGTKTLQQQLLAKVPVADIRKSWIPGLQEFNKLRQPYLLYSFTPQKGLIQE